MIKEEFIKLYDLKKAELAQPGSVEQAFKQELTCVVYAFGNITQNLSDKIEELEECLKKLKEENTTSSHPQGKRKK